MISTTLRELRSLLAHLGLLAALVLSSLLLNALGGWLSERGGLLLLLLGLTSLWSALLFAAALFLAYRKRQRDRAIDAALERLRAALGAPPQDDEG